MPGMNELRNELETIASCELGDVLDKWRDVFSRPATEELTDEQAARLARYLRAEMGAYGLLSVEHGRENGTSLAAVRRQARMILRRMEG